MAAKAFDGLNLDTVAADPGTVTLKGKRYPIGALSGAGFAAVIRMDDADAPLEDRKADQALVHGEALRHFPPDVRASLEPAQIAVCVWHAFRAAVDARDAAVRVVTGGAEGNGKGGTRSTGSRR